jgi:hypothetical protein
MKTGIFYVSSEQYHADDLGDVPTLSCSLSKILLNNTPSHARMAHPRLNPNYKPKESGRFDIGTAAHDALLEGLDIVTVCDFADWRTKAAQAARDDAYALGKTPLLPDQYQQVLDMCAAAKLAITRCADLDGMQLSQGKSEQTILWVDKTGAHCRARTDWMHDDRSLILDYKTTDIKNPAAWMRAIPGNGYDVQAAFYKRGVKSVTGIDPDFVFFVQETDAPYNCYFVGMPPAYLEIGALKVQAAMTKWVECLRTNTWPGYPSRIMYPDPASWVMAEAEELAAEMEQGFVRYDPHAPGAKENFLFGKVAD